MSKVLVIGALPESLLNFRGDLLRSLIAGGHKVIAMADEAEPAFTSRLNEIGVEFRSFPVQRNGMNPVKDLTTFFALRDQFREQKPDVVLAYTIKPVIWGGLALYGLPRTRFIALITGLGFAFQRGGLLRNSLTKLVSWLYQCSLTRASQVVFQNHDNRDLFIANRIIPQMKCTVVNGSGVDLEKFKFTSSPYEGTVFLTIGRLLGEKGFREFAHSAREIKNRYPATIFRIVGPYDPSPDGISLTEVKQWESEGIVEYCGATEDVRPFIADSHIFVLPSYHEGMPRTVLEVMSMGRPILTTDVPGCRETVISCENGFLVPKANTEALAERMTWFIEHRDQWQRMGLCSRKMAEDRFDVHKVNNALLEIMELQ